MSETPTVMNDSTDEAAQDVSTVAATLDAVPEGAPEPVQEQPVNENLLDITLEARIQFGAREMLLSELLELGSGDVLELDRMVTEPVDLLVGDRIVARGEVVVVGGNFGLHVTEVLAPQPRLESVRCLP